MVVTEFAVCAFQAHYAVQARRSRSVTRKRKREESVPPSSIARSRSCSRTPRDVSGLRDGTVSFFDIGQKKIRTFRMFTVQSLQQTPAVVWRSRVVDKSLAVRPILQFVGVLWRGTWAREQLDPLDPF